MHGATLQECIVKEIKAHTAVVRETFNLVPLTDALRNAEAARDAASTALENYTRRQSEIPRLVAIANQNMPSALAFWNRAARVAAIEEIQRLEAELKEIAETHLPHCQTACSTAQAQYEALYVELNALTARFREAVSQRLGYLADQHFSHFIEYHPGFDLILPISGGPRSFHLKFIAYEMRQDSGRPFHGFQMVISVDNLTEAADVVATVHNQTQGYPFVLDNRLRREDIILAWTQSRHFDGELSARQPQRVAGQLQVIIYFHVGRWDRMRVLNFVAALCDQLQLRPSASLDTPNVSATFAPFIPSEIAGISVSSDQNAIGVTRALLSRTSEPIQLSQLPETLRSAMMSNDSAVPEDTMVELCRLLYDTAEHIPESSTSRAPSQNDLIVLSSRWNRMLRESAQSVQIHYDPANQVIQIQFSN